MALTVVGGIYVERSEFPEMDVIFGSGGRAAAALSELESEVKLVSFVGADYASAIRRYARSDWGVHLVDYEVSETVKFFYYHGLSTPVIRPTRLPLPNAPEIRHRADNVLQFGMLEGHAKVEADRAVYDPQNPEQPERFDASGSRARELAYVLNRGEVLRLTEADSEDAAVRAWVIVKSGVWRSGDVPV